MISQVWGSVSISGEKAVANYDKDSVTMAVVAGLDRIKGFKTEKPDSLFFATTIPTVQ